MTLPEVLIVGRPNVGKSTLFNRLIGRNIALVDGQPGSTRDLKSMEAEWNGTSFLLTDSGGWVPGEKESIAAKVGAMLEIKIRQATALLLVVDGSEGLTQPDEIIVRHLRELNLPTWLLVNKADQFEKWDETLSDFRRLGFENCFPLSASHGIGLDDFLDSLVDFLKRENLPEKDEKEEKKPLKLAFLGKPNVGKSSLVNALLGENKLLVDDLPGTTHDAIPLILEVGNDPLVLVDTAGIRATQRQDSRIEELSVQQTLYELQTCQVALFLLDGEKGITHQDVSIARILQQAFRPVVILINKWDIHPKGAEQARAERITHRELRTIQFAPILFISAKNGQGLDRILPLASAVYEESLKKVPTAQVNNAFQDAVAKQQPPFKKGNQVRFFYGYQRQGHPPAFEVFVSHPESITPSYLRYLEVELRKSVGMESTPLQIVLKAKSDKHGFKKPSYKRNFDPNVSRRKKRLAGERKKKEKR